MKITIITATYNSYPNILDTIECVRQQSYPSIELLVIDGGSTDKTLSVISENTVITKYISEPDNGIYDALNKGIRLATGDVIGFVHSDDLLANNKTIENIANQFKEKTIEGVYGDLVYVDKNNISKVIRYWKSKPFLPKNLKYGWMPAHPTLWLKKEVYQKHGTFDLNLKIAADYEFMLRILKDSSLRFEYLPQLITKMRVGGASNRSLKNILLKSKEDLQAIRKNKVGGICTLFFKNARKIGQFIKKNSTI